MERGGAGVSRVEAPLLVQVSDDENWTLREAKEEVDVCIIMADSHHCMAEINTTLYTF